MSFNFSLIQSKTASSKFIKTYLKSIQLLSQCIYKKWEGRKRRAKFFARKNNPLCKTLTTYSLISLRLICSFFENVMRYFVYLQDVSFIFFHEIFANFNRIIKAWNYSFSWYIKNSFNTVVKLILDCSGAVILQRIKYLTLLVGLACH